MRVLRQARRPDMGPKGDADKQQNYFEEVVGADHDAAALIF